MTKISPEEEFEDFGDDQRFDVALFIKHPSKPPEAIAASLGLVGHIVHPVGERRHTPRGTLLPGTYRKTSWRHKVRYTVRGQHFADQLAEFIANLEPHAAFPSDLMATGGTACVIVALLGDGHYGDSVRPATLGRLARLGVDLGIESYTVPQT